MMAPGPLAPLLLMLCAAAPSGPLPVVPDLQRGQMYGDFYEVATYLQWMQIGCSNTMMSFGPAPGDAAADAVTLRCDRGPFQQSVHGTAVPLRAEEPARSRATFRTPLGADYVEEFHIMLAAPDYAWAVVGHPERHLLWVLARARSLPTATLRDIIGRLEADFGYVGVRERLSCTRQRDAAPQLCRAALQQP